MTSGRTEKLLTALGFDLETGRLYDRLRPLSGRRIEEVAESLETSVVRLQRDLEAFAEHEVVRAEDGVLVVLDPEEAVTTMLDRMAEGAATAHQRLAELARALPLLASSSARLSDATVVAEQPLDGELVSYADYGATLTELGRGNTGDLCYLRPDQWVMPYEDELLGLVRTTVEAGRRCRGIYAARALVDAPVALAARAEAGEEIRLLPEVPTRMLLAGTTHALLPEPFGSSVTSPMVIIRQAALVEAMALLFEQMWQRASPVADFERDVRHSTQRAFLLEQLASGAQDEQIARRLGVSLRTVRRRVAELMTELDVHSRFQAGVEAARRGWV